jgi:NAD(P)-dependent dehydrogenase (short-subunit alcohol dehydrogenase family)
MAGKSLPQGIAVFTGAAGGMGSACARRLAEAGWTQLLLCDVSEQRLEAVAGPLRDAGNTVDILAGDVADPSFPAKVLDALQGKPISALVHAAGISPLQGSAERIIEVNLDATVRLVDALRDEMAPGSAAILFASNSSYFPMPPDAAAAFTAPLPAGGALSLAHLAPRPEIAYPLSKLGVRALVKREAKRFGERGVRLASMSPGAIDTPMTQGNDFEIARRMVDGSASGRMGQPEELAAVVAFMCSPEASFVTGVDWLVDGGHTAGMGV